MEILFRIVSKEILMMRQNMAIKSRVRVIQVRKDYGLNDVLIDIEIFLR